MTRKKNKPGKSLRKVIKPDAEEVLAEKSDAESIADSSESKPDEEGVAAVEPLASIEAERDDYRDRLQRTTADFSNYQKRMQRDMEETRKFAAGPIALDLLGVVDNFHRALEAGTGKVNDDYLQGLKMIEELLLATLQKHGVVPIDAVNRPFDPNFHDALIETEDDSLPDKTVLEELERGYLIHERLLRPTKVRVSRIPATENEEEDDDSKSDEQENAPQKTDR